jgi:hypothetical protein
MQMIALDDMPMRRPWASWGKVIIANLEGTILITIQIRHLNVYLFDGVAAGMQAIV